MTGLVNNFYAKVPLSELSYTIHAMLHSVTSIIILTLCRAQQFIHTSYIIIHMMLSNGILVWLFHCLLFHTQLSCSSGSIELSDRNRFPKHFQVLHNSSTVAATYHGIVNEYKWRHVAFIVQDEKLFSAVSQE